MRFSNQIRSKVHYKPSLGRPAGGHTSNFEWRDGLRAVRPIHASPPHRESGFALIITLTLMALVVLVLLSLTIVTRVETTVAGNTVRIDQARENARLALNVAIGELQLHAGADNRITAPANVIDANQLPYPESLHMPNPYWTGVWEPTPGNVGNPYAPLRLRTWLVSGNSNHTGAIQANEGHITYRANNWNRPGTAAPNDNTIGVPWDTNSGVTLVDLGSTRTAETGINANNVYNRNVRVPLRPITAQRVPGFPAAQERVLGAYAFWVGDEGVKADISVYDRSGDISGFEPIDQNLSGLISAQWNNARDVTGRFNEDSGSYETIQFSSFSRDRSQLSRLMEYNQITPLMNTSSGIGLGNDARMHARKDRFHDLTVGTRTLFTNPVDGRLKLDLSARSGGSYPAVNFDEDDPGSVNLAAIHSFLADHGNWDFSGPLNSVLKPSIPVSSLPGRYPVITKSQSNFRFYNRQEGQSYFLSFDALFEVELWNPYSHALDLRNVTLELGVVGLPTVTVVTEPPPAVPHGGEVSLSSVIDNTRFELDPSIELLEPGEVIVFIGGGGARNTLVAGGGFEPLTYETNLNTTPAPPAPDQPPPTPVVTSIGIPASVPPGHEIILAADPGGGDPTVRLQRHQTLSYDGGNAGVGAQNAYQFAFYHGLGDETAGTDIFNDIDPRDPDLLNPYLIVRLETNGANLGVAPRMPLFGLFAPHGTTRTAVFFELPRMEPHSIGSLQHVPLTDSAIPGLVPYALGDPQATSLNTLFDRAFFSTMPRSANHLSGQNNGSPVLDNPRVEPVFRNDELPSDASLATDDLFDYERAAYDLWAKGGFNINSTSVEAWVAVLGGIIGTLDFFDDDTVQGGTRGIERGILRFPQSAGTTATLRSHPNLTKSWSTAFNTFDDHVFTRGIRNLSPLQIRRMAEEIVLGVRERGRSPNGPFPSMAEFLSWTRSGGIFAGRTVLEAAIERANLNTMGPPPDPDSGVAEPPPYASSHITQADIMSSVGAHWTVRSDTFRIRAYGDKRNPVTGEIEARAYCEAIVQRVPDPVGLANPSDPQKIDASDNGNNPFGRQFRIVSFRWLSADEI